jgi:hypothetical protein
MIDFYNILIMLINEDFFFIYLMKQSHSFLIFKVGNYYKLIFSRKNGQIKF